MRYLKSWLTALSVVPLSLYAITGYSASAAENLHRLLASINSLSGRFDQLVIDNSGSRLQQTQGELWLKRPGLFRWRTAEPFPQLLVADGEALWFFDEDLEQVTRQDLDERATYTPAMLLSGNKDHLLSAFEISGPVEGDSGVYQLTPKAKDAPFDDMKLFFSAGMPSEIQLLDSLGQRTSIALLDLEPNPVLDDALFTFTPPAGVDLISE